MNNKGPNIVFVLTDDQGYGDLGCTGNPWLRTPHIDRFAAECVRLTNYHVGPTCAPTRAGLLTGHYANSTGVYHTIGGRSLLRTNECTLADALRENGYRTGIFGKWHLGDMTPYRPTDRGFDVAVVHGGGAIGQTPDHWGNDYFDDTYSVNDAPRQFQGYCTDVFFNEALTFIKENRDRPFFCYLPTNAPHGPYNVENRYSERFKGQMPEDRTGFYGMIENIDGNFGMLRDKLREWGLEDNTILIFMTDNGTSTGVTLDRFNGWPVNGYGAGLRGAKGSEYDGGHRVPFFIRWPGGNIGGNRDVNSLTANVDLMPTLLDLCAIPVPEERSFHGKSIRNLLLGEDNGEDRVVVTDSQRLVFPVKWKQSAVMTNRWRLINGRELYDINVDREQRHDIAGQNPDVVQWLRGEYDKWWELVDEQLGYYHEIPIAIGETPTGFTSHDMRAPDEYLAHTQGQVRSGMEVKGHWEIKVEKSGEYRIELRRWPREAGHAMTAGIDGDDVVWRRDAIFESVWPNYTGGKALPLKEATLAIQGKTYKQSINEDDQAAIFDIHLEAGSTPMLTWLSDGQGLRIAAYYVYAEMKSMHG